MTEWTEYDGYEDDDQGGNDLVKQLRKKIADDAKAARARDEEFATLKAQVRTRTVADVLSGKGIPAKVAGLIPETVEATESAVDAWLGEYSDVFGIKQADAGNETGTAETTTVVTPEQTALNRMTQTATTGVVPDNKFAEQINEVATMPYEDLLRKIAEAQNG